MMVHFNCIHTYLQVLFMGDHFQTKKSMLARGLKACSMMTEQCGWWWAQRMELYLYYGNIRAHSKMHILMMATQRLLRAKKSSQSGNNCGGQNMQQAGKHRCQSSHYWVPTVWVVWKLQVGERYPAVPPSSHYIKTPKFLTAFSLFHL